MAQSLRETLQQRVQARFISIADLELNKKYLITNMEKTDTQFGMAIKATLEKDNKVFEVFLPRSVYMSDDKIAYYNSGEEEIFLVYKGKDKRRFIINFV